MRPVHVFWIVALLTALRLIALAGDAIPLYGDEAQYWIWSRDLAFGYWSKPPMIAWLIRAGTELLGDREMGVRLFAPLLHAGTAGWIYGIGAGLFDKRVGAWSALLYALLPGVSTSAMIMSTDAPLLFFWAAALCCFVRLRAAPAGVGSGGWAGGGWGWAIGFGVAFGCALLSKYVALFLPISLALYAVVAERGLWRDRRLWVGLALGVAILSPNLIWNLHNDLATLRHTQENANLGGGPQLRPGQWAAFFGAQFGVFGPILFALLLVRLARLRGLIADPRLWLLASCVIPVLATMCAVALMSRAHANWAAACYVAATPLVAHGLVQGLDAPGAWRRWTQAALAGTFALHLVGLAALLAPRATLGLVGVELSKRTDPYRRMRGARALAKQLDRHLRQAPPDTVVMTEERLLFATLAFYLRPRPEQAAFDWNDQPQNHFELIADYKRFPERPILFITRDPRSVALGRYREATPLGALEIRPTPDETKTYWVYRLQGLTPSAATLQGGAAR